MSFACNRIVSVSAILALFLLTFAGVVECQKADASKGQAIIKKMSDKLAGAKSFSFSTKGVSDKVRRSGKKERRNFTRDVIVKRPDSFSATYTGEADWKIWYDGKFITAVSDSNKAFIQRQVPATLDETMDVLAERLGMDLPMSDLIYSNPYEAFMSAKATGGFVGTETIEGGACSHLSYKGTAANWQIWVNDETSLPCKFEITYNESPGVPFYSMTFSNWNLTPDIKSDAFTFKIPDGYERLPIMERVILTDEAPAQTQTQTKPKN